MLVLQWLESKRPQLLLHLTVFYNGYRMHSYLGYKSPNQYEKEIIETKIAA